MLNSIVNSCLVLFVIELLISLQSDTHSSSDRWSKNLIISLASVITKKLRQNFMQNVGSNLVIEWKNLSQIIGHSSMIISDDLMEESEILNRIV